MRGPMRVGRLGIGMAVLGVALVAGACKRNAPGAAGGSLGDPGRASPPATLGDEPPAKGNDKMGFAGETNPTFRSDGGSGGASGGSLRTDAGADQPRNDGGANRPR